LQSDPIGAEPPLNYLCDAIRTTRRTLRADVIAARAPDGYRGKHEEVELQVQLEGEDTMVDVNRSEESRYDLGLLFTDGLPDLDDGSGYRGAVAARAAGISYRQLDYWARTQLVE